ncbi:MAG: DUF1800 family protein, partial [Sphingobacteriales bacterium]
MALLQNQHLLWRTGFGPASSGDWANLRSSELYSQIRQASAAPPAYIDVLDEELIAHYKLPSAIKKFDDVKRLRVMGKHHSAVLDINLRWFKEMTESKAQLREKMAFFWHGHFPTKNLNIYYVQGLLHVLRTHALGNFRNLLEGVSKSPAMMVYLNAQQNRKGHPNENFARELMELF